MRRREQSNAPSREAPLRRILLIKYVRKMIASLDWRRLWQTEAPPPRRP